MDGGANLIFGRTLRGGDEDSDYQCGAQPKESKDLEEEASHIT
jgi:hypothetical protein